MSQRVALCGKTKGLGSTVEAKASLNRAHSRMEHTRNRVIYSWSELSLRNRRWRLELVDVEKSLDEL